MAKYDVRTRNPIRFAAASARQQDLRRRYANIVTRDMLCDYCGHTIAVYLKGSHGATAMKCSKCGETTLFEPISFRLSS